jgi:hypothetical protein
MLEEDEETANYVYLIINHFVFFISRLERIQIIAFDDEEREPSLIAIPGLEGLSDRHPVPPTKYRSAKLRPKCMNKPNFGRIV